MRDTSLYHPVARNHRSPLPAFTGHRGTETQSDHDAEKEAAQAGERRGKSTNLELPGTTRAVREASATLSQPQIPELCLLSPHSVLAEGGSNLNNKVRGEISLIQCCRASLYLQHENLQAVVKTNKGGKKSAV